MTHDRLGAIWACDGAVVGVGLAVTAPSGLVAFGVGAGDFVGVAVVIVGGGVQVFGIGGEFTGAGDILSSRSDCGISEVDSVPVVQRELFRAELTKRALKMLGLGRSKRLV